MEWEPKTDEQLQEENLLQPGAYAFDVLTCEEQEDKEGKPMFALKLDCHGDDKSQHVYDYISPNWMPHKFKYFFHTIGCPEMYESGKTGVEAHELIGKSGRVALEIEPAGKFPAKNTVSHYLIDADTAPRTDDKDDDLPW
jgi:hypothetical protein